MTEAGVVAVPGADRWWAWGASRVRPRLPPQTEPGPSGRGAGSPPLPAAGTAVQNEFSGQASKVVQVGVLTGGLHVHESPRSPTVPDDSAWLRASWEIAVAARATFEMRLLNRSDRSGLDGFLVIRADGPDRGAATRAVAGLRARLGEVPRHVDAAPVTGDDELRAILEPFRPHAGGLVEIRKRLTVTRPTRDDAHGAWLTAVTPLSYREQSWDPLWTELSRLPFRALLSVALLPYRVGPGLTAHLRARAAELRGLAEAGSSPTAVWRSPRPPDQFAALAAPLMSDAIQRYTDRAFLVRVSLAAEERVPSMLAELLAETITAREPNRGFAGAPPAVVRPWQEDFATAWTNITSLNFDPLAGYTQGHPAEAVGELERILGSIVDLDEAAAAFRFPYATGGGTPLF